VNRYARGLDRHDEGVLASVYHEDAVDQHGDIRGRDDFVRWANRFHEADWTAHNHFITNHRAEIEGDVAFSETYFFAALLRKDGAVVDLAGGRYVDRLERRGRAWRIAARETVVDWQAKADAQAFGGDNLKHGTWDRSDLSYQRP
jgi:hypothetical protein